MQYHHLDRTAEIFGLSNTVAITAQAGTIRPELLNIREFYKLISIPFLYPNTDIAVDQNNPKLGFSLPFI
jgi:hypothetical protein